MKNYNRDLLVLLRAPSVSGAAFEKHVECLHRLLMHVECAESFYRAHQLATRLKITDKKRAILKAASKPQLKPFFFLINKN